MIIILEDKLIRGVGIIFYLEFLYDNDNQDDKLEWL
jgi:hypothetical protein